jgi:hypothetical protein
MNIVIKLWIVLIVAASTVLQGCAVPRDPRLAAWDPARDRSLFEQLPNWQHESTQVCGGRLRPEDRVRRGLSDRC